MSVYDLTKVQENETVITITEKIMERLETAYQEFGGKVPEWKHMQQ
jgi:hypothetical protein